MCQFVKLLEKKRIMCGSLMLRSIKGTDQEEENCRSLHPIIPFSNSFFDFPLLFEYLPIILIILYVCSALSAWLG